MLELNEMFSPENSEMNKRKVLIGKVRNGEPISNSKTPWTEKQLETASEKKIDQLYDNLSNSKGKQNAANESLSRELGVRDFGRMMNELNENPLVSSKMTEIFCSNSNEHNSLELFGVF